MTPAVEAMTTLAKLPAEEVRSAIMCERGKRSLSSFIRQMWPVHHPATPLRWNWHIDCMAEHLRAVYLGQILHLAIAVPPGFVKSLTVSVYFPAWVWLQAPSWQFLCVSALSDLAMRDARRHREICASDEYQRTYRPDWGFLKSQDAKGYFQNEAGGYRISRTTGQAITGLRGDCLIMDDALDASKAFADKTALEEINHWRDTVFSTRKNTPDSREVVIAQRLHENDPIGHLLAKDAADWFYLVMPMEFERKRTFVSPIGYNDKRTEEGELLFPDFVDKKKLEQIKTQDLGEAAYSAQYQQQPVPEQGTVFHRMHFRYWIPTGTVIEWRPDDPTRELTVELDHATLDAKVASCDFNRLEQPKHTRSTDYAVIDLWGTRVRDRFLLQQVRQKLSLAASILAVRQLYEHHPDLHRTLIEKSANGPSVIAAVQAECEGIEGVSVQGESKIQRAGAVAPVVEQGRVYIPHPYLWPWVEHWLEEVCGFPGRRRDDRVDAFTMAIIWIEKNLAGAVFTFPL